MEHIERAHPLGVSFRQVVVDGHDVDALAGERVQEDRERRDEGLAFAGRHFGDLALVEDDAADELDVVMDHVPGHFVAAGHPGAVVDGVVAVDRDEVVGDAEVAVEGRRRDGDRLVLGEAAGGRLHDRESLGEDFVEGFLDRGILVLDELLGLVRELLLLGNRNIVLHLRLDLGEPALERRLGLDHPGTEGGAALAQPVVGQLIYLIVASQDLRENRLDLFHIPVGLGAEQFAEYTCN